MTNIQEQTRTGLNIMIYTTKTEFNCIYESFSHIAENMEHLEDYYEYVTTINELLTSSSRNKILQINLVCLRTERHIEEIRLLKKGMDYLNFRFFKDFQFKNLEFDIKELMGEKPYPTNPLNKVYFNAMSDNEFIIKDAGYFIDAILILCNRIDLQLKLIIKSLKSLNDPRFDQSVKKLEETSKTLTTFKYVILGEDLAV